MPAFKSSTKRIAKTLRLPESLNAKLEECAKENGRSLNQEIVYRLHQSINGYRR